MNVKRLLIVYVQATLTEYYRMFRREYRRNCELRCGRSRDRRSHSSGSFLAVDVLARALVRDPALGRHGPKLALLTIAANLPIVRFHPSEVVFATGCGD